MNLDNGQPVTRMEPPPYWSGVVVVNIEGPDDESLEIPINERDCCEGEFLAKCFARDVVISSRDPEPVTFESTFAIPSAGYLTAIAKRRDHSGH